MRLPSFLDLHEGLVPAALALAAVAAAVSLFANAPRQAGTQTTILGAASVRIPPPVEPVSLIGADLYGDATATLVLLEFTDFECPYCNMFATRQWPVIRQRLIDPGAMALAIRHLPLETVHDTALDAALVAECAAERGQFWAIHDQLFLAAGAKWQESLAGLASHLKLAPADLTTCMKRPQTLESVMADKDEARRLNVRSTPTFFLGRRRADGTMTATARFAGSLTSEEIEREIAANREEASVP